MLAKLSLVVPTIAFPEMSSLSGYHDDTDSDNEEGVMEKLASAIGHLFTG